jgi:hypothetical protein
MPFQSNPSTAPRKYFWDDEFKNLMNMKHVTGGKRNGYLVTEPWEETMWKT